MFDYDGLVKQLTKDDQRIAGVRYEIDVELANNGLYIGWRSVLTTNKRLIYIYF